MLVGAEQAVVLAASIRLLKEVKAILYTQDAAHGIVDARHFYLTFVH